MGNMCAAIGRAHEFFLCLQKAGLTDEIIKQVINSPKNQAAEAIVQAYLALDSTTPKLPFVESLLKGEEFILRIDYRASLEGMIAAGIYDEVDKNINSENFPLTAGEKKEEKYELAKLFNFGEKVRSSKAIAKMREQDYRPATLAELLALGGYIPKLQNTANIVALGSVGINSNLRESVPLIGKDGLSSERILDLIYILNYWGDDEYFLGISQAPAILSPIIEAYEYNLVVDYSRTFKEMIRAGEFDSEDRKFRAQSFSFPGGQKVNIKAKTFCFNQGASFNQAYVAMDRNGYRSADQFELLALGEIYPELQRQFPIIALAIISQNEDAHLGTLCLGAHGKTQERYLRLDDSVKSRNTKSNNMCRYLAIPK